MKTSRYARVPARGLPIEGLSRGSSNRVFRKAWIIAREAIPGILVFGLLYAAFIHATN